MELHLVTLFSFQFVLYGFENVAPFGNIQISTCDVPTFNTSFSVCCYAENLPSNMIINFYDNLGHVTMIPQYCRFQYEDFYLDWRSGQRVRCAERGNTTVYTLTEDNKLFQDYADVTFECGNYIDKAKTTITVLHAHSTSYHLPESSPQLYFKIPSDLTSNVRFYVLQSNVTLLEVDQENNVTFQSDRIVFDGDVRHNYFSAKILKLQRQWNGTYVCEYTISSGQTIRDGITIVVLGKPLRPEIRIINREVVGNEISVHVTCDAVSGSAAPLFYKPQFETEWIIPSSEDWPTWFDGFQILTNGSSAYISNMICNETVIRTLPWYCTVSEHSIVSDKSIGFLPDIVCSNTDYPMHSDDVTSVTFFFGTIGAALLIVPSAQDFRSDDVQRALETIAMEESRQNYEIYNTQTSDGTRAADCLGTEDAQLQTLQNSEEMVSIQNSLASSQLRGAEGGARYVENEDHALLKEVESLLERHHDHLSRNVEPIRVSRKDILEQLMEYYTEEAIAKSRVTVKFVGEEGMDCGGVTYDMFTTFWYRAQEEFFIGYETVVPYLPPQRFMDDSKYRILGRILSHSIAVMKEIPIRMCKSTIIAMIYETTDVSADVLLEDFLYFLDDHDRNLVTTAINSYRSLTPSQSDELMTIFERFEYAIMITADNFKFHVTQLARHVICIRPRPLLDKMRSGIPQSHLDNFWSHFHLKVLGVLFRALRPTSERVIASLKTSNITSLLTRQQIKAFNFLKDLLKEMSEPELETFLHFVTGKKSIPREKITIEFTTTTGVLRLPKAHTCSNMMELPATYENYETFRSEFKHLLASDEALKMTMA